MRDQDLIITLVILAVSGLSALLQKKRQAREQGQFDQPRHPAAPPVPRESTQAPPEPKPFDLEEQLRRILEGDLAPRPAPPPIEEIHPTPPPPPPKPAPAEVIYSETQEPAARAMGQLPQAAHAYMRAAQLPEAVATHLGRVHDHPQGVPPAISKPPVRTFSPVAAETIAQLRSPQSARQAFVTATILGRPKALGPLEN